MTYATDSSAILARSCEAGGQVGATPWFNHQGQAHIVSTAIRSPVPARGPAEVGGKPWFRPWFSIDPQPASISPTVSISIVFICALLDYGRISHHPAIKNELRSVKRRQDGKPVHHSLESPLCSCVSITLPASS